MLVGIALPLLAARLLGVTHADPMLFIQPCTDDIAAQPEEMLP